MRAQMDPVARLRGVMVYRQQGGPTTCLGSLAMIDSRDDGCLITPFQEGDRTPIAEALARDRYLVIRGAGGEIAVK